MQDLETGTTNTEARYRLLVILWFGFLAANCLFFVLTFVIVRQQAQPANPALSWTLVAIGVSMAMVSVLLKQKTLAQAVEKQQPQLVQTGYLITFALTETISMIGLFMYFVLPGRTFYLMFLVAFIFMLLHFPRHENIAAASFKRKF